MTGSDIYTLADSSCRACNGAGMSCPGGSTCDCVYRRVFDLCYEVYEAHNPYSSGVVVLGINASRPHEEYQADFCRLGEAGLSEVEAKIFKAYYCCGTDVFAVCRKLGLSQGVLYGHLKRIQVSAGRAFAETKPFGIYPVSAYFRGTEYARNRAKALEEYVPEEVAA